VSLQNSLFLFPVTFRNGAILSDERLAGLVNSWRCVCRCCDPNPVLLASSLIIALGQ